MLSHYGNGKTTIESVGGGERKGGDDIMVELYKNSELRAERVDLS